MRIGYIRDNSPAGRVLFEGPAEAIRTIEVFFGYSRRSQKQRTLTAVHLDEFEDLRGEAVVLVPFFTDLYVFDYPEGFDPKEVDELQEELDDTYLDHRCLVFDYYWNPKPLA